LAVGSRFPSQDDHYQEAFLLGGIACFGITMEVSTFLGLAAVAFSHGSNLLISLSSSEVSAVVPAVKAAAAPAGQWSCSILILHLLAVTSACSAEETGVLTYHIYGTYIDRIPDRSANHLVEKNLLQLFNSSPFQLGLTIVVHHYMYLAHQLNKG
jgi:hypothetical protein